MVGEANTEILPTKTVDDHSQLGPKKFVIAYSIAVITFYLLRPLIQSVQLFITFAT
jgi:hypothetical protein